MTEMSTKTMNCNCGDSTVCSHEDEDQHRIRKSSLHVGKREFLPEASRLMPNTYPLLNQEER